ncbi:MAG TPA: hypothetical protein VLC91_10970, partial [Spongiibacteraceae bacterium]|nr:hypothetical protein [Spongiibacteraceae bacterium]
MKLRQQGGWLAKTSLKIKKITGRWWVKLILDAVFYGLPALMVAYITKESLQTLIDGYIGDPAANVISEHKLGMFMLAGIATYLYATLFPRIDKLI